MPMREYWAGWGNVEDEVDEETMAKEVGEPKSPFGIFMSGVSEEEEVEIFCALFVLFPIPSRAC